MLSTQKKTAEENFREAFSRLKSNKPTILPIGTPVTQNNVAKEAGKHPTALKKDRYPSLISEIQAYLEANLDVNKNNRTIKLRNNSRNIKRKLQDFKNQRDRLASIVEAQDNYIAELLSKIDDLENKDNVVRKIKKL